MDHKLSNFREWLVGYFDEHSITSSAGDTALYSETGKWVARIILAEFDQKAGEFSRWLDAQSDAALDPSEAGAYYFVKDEFDERFSA